MAVRRRISEKFFFLLAKLGRTAFTERKHEGEVPDIIYAQGAKRQSFQIGGVYRLYTLCMKSLTKGQFQSCVYCTRLNHFLFFVFDFSSVKVLIRLGVHQQYFIWDRLSDQMVRVSFREDGKGNCWEWRRYHKLSVYKSSSPNSQHLAQHLSYSSSRLVQGPEGEVNYGLPTVTFPALLECIMEPPHS